MAFRQRRFYKGYTIILEDGKVHWVQGFTEMPVRDVKQAIAEIDRI